MAVINLNRYRKAKKREAEQQRAGENRARFGRTKQERHSGDEERKRTKRELDGKRLD
jgi:hypothetical protein